MVGDRFSGAIKGFKGFVVAGGIGAGVNGLEEVEPVESFLGVNSLLDAGSEDDDVGGGRVGAAKGVSLINKMECFRGKAREEILVATRGDKLFGRPLDDVTENLLTLAGVKRRGEQGKIGFGGLKVPFPISLAKIVKGNLRGRGGSVVFVEGYEDREVV